MDMIVDMGIGIGLLVATIVLFLIVLLAFTRMRNTRMLFFTLGFGTFFVGAFLHLLEMLIEDFSLMITENILLFFQLIGLLFIAIGVLKD